MSSKPHHLSRAVISPRSAIATQNGVGMSYVWKVIGAKYLLLKILLQIFHTISPQCSTFMKVTFNCSSSKTAAFTNSLSHTL